MISIFLIDRKIECKISVNQQPDNKKSSVIIIVKQVTA